MSQPRRPRREDRAAGGESEGGARPQQFCGLGALVLSSGQLNVLFLPLGWTGAVAAGAALSWVPLWGGILLRLRSTDARETGAISMPSAAEKPDEHRAAEARPGQRPPRVKTPRADSGGP